MLIPKNCQGYWTTEGYFFDDADPPPVVASITLEASFSRLLLIKMLPIAQVQAVKSFVHLGSLRFRVKCVQKPRQDPALC